MDGGVVMEENKVKVIGMIHIPGVNDKQYEQYLVLEQLKKDNEQVMQSVIVNRW